MCSITGVVAGFSALSGIAGSMAQAQAKSQAVAAQNQANEYNKKIALANAQLALEQKQSALESASDEASDVKDDGNAATGQMIANLGLGGIEVTGDSTAGSLIEQSYNETNEDVQTTLKNGRKQAKSYDIEYQNYMNQYNMYQASINNNSSNSGATFLSGLTNVATNVASIWA